MMGDNAAEDNAAGDFAAGDNATNGYEIEPSCGNRIHSGFLRREIASRMDTKLSRHAGIVSIQGFFGERLRRGWIRN